MNRIFFLKSDLNHNVSKCQHRQFGKPGKREYASDKWHAAIYKKYINEFQFSAIKVCILKMYSKMNNIYLYCIIGCLSFYL